MDAAVLSGFAVVILAALVVLDVALEQIRRIPDRRDSAASHRHLMGELAHHTDLRHTTTEPAPRIHGMPAARTDTGGQHAP
jgi:hypothetical protein